MLVEENNKMKFVTELSKTRCNVFVNTTRNNALKITDFVEVRFDADKFLGEHFQTQEWN